MRDVEIFERMAKRGLPVSVNLSVPTLDEKAWRATEPHTPSPAARLDAVAELRRRGIESGVLIAPLMPGINDTPEQVQPIVDRAREAGANFLGGVALHLRGEVKDVFFGWLEEKRPDLLPRYEQLYRGGRGYMQPSDRVRVAKVVRGWGEEPEAPASKPGELQAGRTDAERDQPARRVPACHARALRRVRADQRPLRIACSDQLCRSAFESWGVAGVPLRRADTQSSSAN